MFTNITEERFEEIMGRYRGCIPNASNSDYHNNKINFFQDLGQIVMHTQDDPECSWYEPSMDNSLMRNEAISIMAALTEAMCSETMQSSRFSYGSLVQGLTMDLDILCELAFYDIILQNDVTEEQLIALCDMLQSKF